MFLFFQPTPQQIRRPVQQRVISSPQQQVIQQQQQQQQQQQVQVQQYQTRQPSQQLHQQQQSIHAQQQNRQNTLGQDSRLRKQNSTPPPVQTINRYMRNNPDGSMSWGYENDDGKLILDCFI